MQNVKDLRTSFKNKDLFDQSLTHKSWINENANKRESYERLEFLGDAILDFVVTKHLYEKFADKDEGYLTNLRANIVNTKNLYKLAQLLDLGSLVFLSKGEEETGGRSREYLLADVTEALIGAIYLDQGIKATEKFVLENILSDIDEKVKMPLKDPKTRLQEYCNSKKMSMPRYKTVSATGPDNAKEFTVEIQIGNKIYGKGTGKSKQAAQENAAAVALEALIL